MKYLLLFSSSIFSDSLQLHGLQHDGFPVLHHLTELAQTHVRWVSDAIQQTRPLRLLLLLPQSFPASGSFLISWLLASGGQSIWASVSASVLLMNIHDWFPLGFTSLISLQSKGLSRVFFNTTVQKHQFLGSQLSFGEDSWESLGLQGDPTSPF